MNLFIGNNFSKVAVIFRYSETMYQWCNYCHRDAHYIIYYKSVHISGITLHSIPNLFAKLIFDSLMISNKESTRSIRTNIQNSFLKQKTYKSASTAILSRKRNHDSWLQCNESSKTNIYIYTYTRNEGYFLPFISILLLTCVFIHFRQDHQREINYRRKKEPRG